MAITSRFLQVFPLFFCFLSYSLASPAPIIIGAARFTVLTPQVIRIEYSANHQFVDDPSLFAINRDVQLSATEETQIHIDASSHDLHIDTGRIALTYHDDGKPLSETNLQAKIRWNINEAGLDSASEWHFGKPSLGNLGGTLNRLDQVSGQVPLNEGLLSRDGWYYLEDSNRFLTQDGWVKLRDPKTDQVDGFLFGYGLDYRSALKDMTRVSGDVPLPRRYSLGTWYSRWWPYSSKDYRTIIQEFHDHDFPIDMLVMDMDWHREGWTGYSWNLDLIPDGDELLADLHQKGIHVTLNDHPQEGIKPIEDIYAEFMIVMGQDPSLNQTLKFDAGNRKYIDTNLSLAHGTLEQTGVDFWWLDWMGDDQSPYNQLPWMNELYYRHSEKSQLGRDLRGMSFSRWADWGDHRHPIHFSGDTEIAWSTLAFEVPFTATANNVGVFYWSHDIGGFTNGNPFADIDELLARWTQFGATSAALRLHSTNHWWLDKRPWAHSSQTEESMRRSFHFRSELFPYIYTAAWESHDRSVGFDRPLYIDYPSTPEAYQNPQEYLWGDAFLVAPITSPGDGDDKIASQKVWLPEGRWFDWFSGNEMTGGPSITVAHDINTFPLFARGGVPIVMQPYAERMATTPLNHLIIRIYPGETGKTYQSQLYEDDGETRGYLNKEYALTPLTYSQEQTNGTLEIAPAQGVYDGQIQMRSYEIQFDSFQMNAQQPLRITVNDEPASVIYDTRTHMNRILIPEINLNQRQIIRIQFP